jgi:hypothetical protein
MDRVEGVAEQDLLDLLVLKVIKDLLEILPGY